jgi:CheY-like chemotaxis protein
MPEPRARILIVDNREQARCVLRRLLVQAGSDCREADTGSGAIWRIIVAVNTKAKSDRSGLPSMCL